MGVRGLMLGLCCALLAGCDLGAPEAVPISTVAPSPAPAAAGADIEATVREVTVAVESAQALREALRLVQSDSNWDRVVRACGQYPLGPVDPAFGVRLTQGLQAKAVRAAWWPEPVLALDAAAATTCFVTGSASAIPPGARVEANGPTTSEIAAQPLQSALDDLRDASPQALRAAVEARALAGSRG